MKNELTHARALELLCYDPLTGVITRRVSLSNSVAPGEKAGYVHPTKGYLYLYVDGKRYFAHRVVWLLMTGVWPPEQIDHIDRDRGNNRWGNLRLASNAQNGQNKGLSSDNSSGLRGVSWSEKASKWKAQIGVEGRVKYLGLYTSREEAHSAYLQAKSLLHRV